MTFRTLGRSHIVSTTQVVGITSYQRAPSPMRARTTKSSLMCHTMAQDTVIRGFKTCLFLSSDHSPSVLGRCGSLDTREPIHGRSSRLRQPPSTAHAPSGVKSDTTLQHFTYGRRGFTESRAHRFNPHPLTWPKDPSGHSYTGHG